MHQKVRFCRNNKHMRLPIIEPPAGLLEKILGKIHAAQLRQLRVRLGLALTGVCASLFYIVANWSAIWFEFRQSSFVEYLRLLISDSDIALANAKEFVLGLLESIPAASIVSGSIFIFCAVSLIGLLLASRQERRQPLIRHAV
jgi:hypothetical protein